MGGGSKGEAQKKRDGSESKINDRKTETNTEEAEGKELEKQKEKDIGTGLERKEQLNGGREKRCCQRKVGGVVSDSPDYSKTSSFDAKS